MLLLHVSICIVTANAKQLSHTEHARPQKLQRNQTLSSSNQLFFMCRRSKLVALVSLAASTCRK